MGAIFNVDFSCASDTFARLVTLTFLEKLGEHFGNTGQEKRTAAYTATGERLSCTVTQGDDALGLYAKKEQHRRLLGGAHDRHLNGQSK